MLQWDDYQTLSRAKFGTNESTDMKIFYRITKKKKKPFKKMILKDKQ